MTALAVVLLALGAASTVLMPVWALLTWGARRERRRIARLPVSRCAEVTGAGERLCAVEGRSGPGPQGTLTAPLSGAPCAWYFSQVEERVSGDGPSTRLVWETGGTMAFEVRDASGSVLVDGRLVHPEHRSSRTGHSPPVRRAVQEEVGSAQDSAHLRGLIARGILNEKSFRRGWLSDSLGWSVQEYVLPIGEPLHVQGRPGVREGRPLLGPARRKHLVAGRTHAQLSADIEQDVRTGWGCLLIGSVAGPLLLVAGYLLLRV
ncbi:hypothetical protein SAMN04489727_5117 [Amycolatopsis tolypomycina]|uniref:RING-type E3 ubiquitin transferase n=1 Tax=Amycolatopsis tolypomycina TaxID=208445 RepID=A0A1H4VFZ8_9PSEU|nr:hypothetical protein [Amycolatopsis tolypomycina]SEC79508.1 hypothetical protein SAMN04489727_5117 [Amycolatopsis tolypomycina]